MTSYVWHGNPVFHNCRMYNYEHVEVFDAVRWEKPVAIRQGRTSTKWFLDLMGALTQG